MKKITFLFLFLIGTFTTVFAQFSENFDAATTIPAGWNSINGGDANGFVFGTPGVGTANSGTNVANIIYDSTTAHDDYLVTPQITVTAGVNDRLTFWVKTRSAAFIEHYEVKLSTATNSVATDFSVTLMPDTASTTTWAKQTINLTPYVGQSVYVGFHAVSLDKWELYFDDVVNDAMPTCDVPGSIAASAITYNSATLSWTAPTTTNSGYEYVLDSVATDPTVSGTPLSALTYSATGLTPLTVYYFHIRSICGTAGNSLWSTITFTTKAIPPANDDCANAVTITCGTTLTNQSTLGATGGTTTSCIGTIGDDIWYHFTGDGQQNILTAVASVQFPQVEVYESTDGTCAGFTAGSCFASAGSGSSTTSVVFNSTLGNEYYIHIGNYINGYPAVVFDLSLTCSPIPLPPANDNCSGAIALTPAVNFTSGATPGTINVAATDTSVAPSCQSLFSADVWYTVVVPASGNITIETQSAASNPMTDSVVAAFSGTCGSLVEVGCDDDTGVGNMSLLSLTGQTPGATLYIGVWKYGTTAPTTVNSQFQIAAYDASLSSASFDTANFRAFPNPVKNVLNLSYNKNITNIAIFNLLGQEVIAKSVNAAQSQVDMTHLATGTYMVKVTSEDGTKTIKVIKE